MLDANAIERMLSSGLPDAQVEVSDLTGDGNHFSAVVRSPHFAGKSRLEQHRMVYAALGDAFSGALHALALRTSAL